MAALIESGQVRYVYRDFVLNSHRPYAQIAAEAAQCAADQGMYWAYHAQLFENQKQWNKAELKAYAEALGLDTQTFNQCLDSGKYTEAVNQMTQEALDVGAPGTPTFVLNGEMLDPYQTPLDQVVHIVRQAAQEK